MIEWLTFIIPLIKTIKHMQRVVEAGTGFNLLCLEEIEFPTDMSQL